MSGKIVLITGGTGGIGKRTAAGLAKLGAQLVVTGRDKVRGERAVKEIQQRAETKKLTCFWVIYLYRQRFANLLMRLRQSIPGWMSL